MPTACLKPVSIDERGLLRLFARIQTRLFQALDKKSYLSKDELFRYVLMLAVSIVACSVHITFSVFFFIVGSLSLCVSHLIGVVVFIFCCVLLGRKRFDMAGILLSLMILCSTLATIYTIGGDNFSILYQLVVLLMLLVVPFSNQPIRIGFMACLPLLMVGSYLFDLWHVPLRSIGNANHVLAVMNIVIASMGMIVLITLEKLVRNFVSRFEKQKVLELENQAFHDPLTGLYNRRYADVHFDKLCSVSSEIVSCVALADIDDFKQVNDTYGHNTGDLVLKMLAEVFKHRLRRSDLVFRWGGEEFLLIINNATPDDTFVLLEDIRKAVLDTTVRYEDTDIQVSITVGIAELDPCNIEESLKVCDQKMYIGKHNGKNMVVV